MRHVFHCALRWADMDAFGHVNNVVFLRYLEEARIDFMFRLARQAAALPAGSPDPAATAGGEEETVPFTGGSVVARHEISYLRPLVHRHEPVTIETWVTRIGGAAATFAYEVKDGLKDEGDAAACTVYARASTIIVPYDLAKERPRRLTRCERSFLEVYVERAEGGRAGDSAKGIATA